ncbi:MAG: Twin-arginine translocation pathway signal [Betaproteobacteria bacterium RIFCSPLOWO2_12_FULL_68_19]|nr:MAG: Twin-arginine translocation pathway signal [Betaproteobacteria bacterium RIFCSPLOWO2_12_FULL_68_19]
MKAKLLLSVLALAATSAFAQYPSRAVTLVVGFAPGGGTDTVARVVQRPLGERLGQQVVVDNKPGAGGNIATDMTAKSAPDGQLVMLANVGSLTVAPHLVKDLPYNPLRDLAPVSMGVIFPNLVVVHASVPANSLAEFIKLAKENPGKYTYGSSGIGGAGHLAGELLKMMASIDIVHVPFKGGGPAMQAMLGGQIHAYMATPVAAGPHVRAGKAKALATTGPQRDPLTPDVPTVAESGYPGYQATNWYAFVVAGRTPRAIVERLNRDIVATLKDPQVIGLLRKQGVEPQPGTPEELAKFMKSEYETWGRVVKEAKIQVQ